MQKKLIAIAIAAVLAPAAAMADTGNVNVYGRLNASLDSQTGITGQTSGLALNTNSSRFGVKGSEDLGDGYKANFQVEATVNLTGTGRGANGNTVANTVTNAQNFGAFGGQIRDTFLGLSTPLGTLQAGRLPMENHWAYDTNLFADQVGDLLTFNAPTGNGRANGELLYTTPNMSGLTANVQFYPTSSVNPTAGVGTPGPAAATSHSWGFEANYTVLDMVKLNFNYLNRNTGFDIEYKPWVISGIMNVGSDGMVNVQYMRDKRTATGRQAERAIFNFGGTYKVMPNGTIKAQYSRANTATSNDGVATAVNGLASGAGTTANMMVFGFDYSLSKRTMVQLAYARTKNGLAANYGINGGGHNNQIVTPTAGDSPRAFGVNVTHNF
ncbi:MAG: porin [Gallionella sp.]|nr:porin [Gallionella sp.]